MMGTMAAPSQGVPNQMPQQYTQQEVQAIYLKWDNLRKQGFNEQTSPEFANLTRHLKAAQQQQQQLVQQQRAAAAAAGQGGQYAQGQQFTRVPQQARPGMPPNGMNQAHVNGRVPSQQPGQIPMSASTASPKQRPPTDPPGKPTLNPSSSFTPDQLSLLHNQILAFKYLSKNVPIPQNLYQILVNSAQGKPLAAQPSAPSGAETATKPDGVVNGTGRATSQSGFETFISPWANLQDQISYLEHGMRDRRLLIPSITPTGLDLDKLQEERERVIHARISARKAELENLASNLAEHNLKSENGDLDDKLKVKALIELKSINLLHRQRQLRLEYMKDSAHAENLAFNTNRAAYRRMKKQSLNEARVTEQLEKAMRQEKQRKEKEKHHSHLEGILARRKKIQEDSFDLRIRKQRIGQKMVAAHQAIEREEQKRMEKTAKQRLAALKANDEDAYLKLLDEAKDTRITHLLRQTDQFLNSLAESVRQQQRDAVRAYGRPEGYIEDDSDDDEDEDGQKVDYYSVAHRIQETITEQPSILIGGKLKEYQLKGLQWMVSLYNNNLNGILADEMGLGKTIQTLSLITFLIEKKKLNGPYLVIVPLSTLTNWNLEFEKWAPAVSKIVYKGTPNMRKTFQQQIRSGNFQVLLTTYEFIIKDRPILSKVKWQYMIVDEGHRMKNASSKLSSTLTTYYNCRYRLILTGTPLQNNLPELWALLNFVLPTIFKSVKSFDEWFNTPFANTGGQDKMELTEEESLLVIRRLHKVLRPFLLRRLKKDVEAELPDKREEVIKCKFSALQAKLYSQMVNNGMLFVADSEKASGRSNIKGLSNVIMQLRKICNHPFVFEEIENAINPSKVNNDTLWRTAGKFELLDRILPKFYATNHRVLIFFQMTQIMNIMEDFLHLRGYKYLRLDGSTKADDRSALLKVFNAPDSEYFIFLLSTRAGGLGLNLQTADTVIIYDSDWNPHQDLQAQDRAHRIGQKNEVRILRLITSNSVEEKILERAQYKLDIDGKVIQAGKFDNKSTNEERDALLRTLLESSKEEIGQDEEMDDDELNEVCARNEEELAIFRRMDEERNRDKMYGINGKYPRLYSDEELPDIYVNEYVPEQPIEAPTGRGARERNQVRYDDGLTEEQWLDAIDNDDDTIEDAVARKREREERRAANKLKKQGVYKEPSPLPPSSPVAETPPPRKKRGRKPTSEKKKEKEVVEEPKRKKAKTKGSNDVLTPTSRAMHQRVFEAVYEAVKNLKDAENPDRLHSEHFIVLPSKKYYPDYYQFIASPICFDMIKKRIDKEQYNSVEELKADFILMFNNARTYNEPGSPVYIDAEKMEEEFNEVLKQEVEKHDLTNNRPSSRDGSASAVVSSVGTPSATPMIKLKIGKRGNTNGANAKEKSPTPYDSGESGDDSE